MTLFVVEVVMDQYLEEVMICILLEDQIQIVIQIFKYDSSFTHQNYRLQTDKAKSFLAGSYNFQVLEIEVYTKQ
jgi:hypothetical protein